MYDNCKVPNKRGDNVKQRGCIRPIWCIQNLYVGFYEKKM